MYVTECGERDLNVWYIVLAHRQAWGFADCLVYFSDPPNITITKYLFLLFLHLDLFGGHL